jgi:uracil-DNA glycosylase
LSQKSIGKTIFPPSNLIFNAFERCSFENTKVLILGQDPYHGRGQAHGLSFSVPNGIAIPPSLQNIYKELNEDIEKFTIPTHGNLTKWADQGVLLLNAFLTVSEGEPASHQAAGWELFTNDVIDTISSQKETVVFLLWGKFAEQKISLIDTQKHLVLTAPHPSPFSAHKGFLGCKHFSKTNAFLISKGLEPIQWNDL